MSNVSPSTVASRRARVLLPLPGAPLTITTSGMPMSCPFRAASWLPDMLTVAFGRATSIRELGSRTSGDKPPNRPSDRAARGDVAAWLASAAGALPVREQTSRYLDEPQAL